MPLKNGKVNPLNVLGIRRCQFPAHHFHYTALKQYTPLLEKNLNRWIYNNMNGRYYIGQGLDLIDNSLVYITKIGFEQEKELTFFRISCPHL